MVTAAPISVGTSWVVVGVFVAMSKTGAEDRDNQDAAAAADVEPGENERADEQAEIEADEADGRHGPVRG